MELPEAVKAQIRKDVRDMFGPMLRDALPKIFPNGFGRKFVVGDVERGCTVHEIETGKTVDQVVSVDTFGNFIVRHEKPLRIVGDEIATERIHYDAIHPIYAGGSKPIMFQCYGQSRKSIPPRH